jgi:SAM-dependent methyltransferase
MTSGTPILFDRAALRARRARAAGNFAAHDFLYREIADRLADRLDDVVRQFPTALDLGARGGLLAEVLGRRGGIETLVRMDLSPAFVTPGTGVVGDEEFLPFAAASFDLIFSVLGLHWVNDLPGALLQVNRALRPDGLFVGAFFGGATLMELSDALRRAETEVEGALSPRTAPLADLRDAAGLMQRAGFALPVVDSEIVTVTYSDPFALMRELRGMAETNVGAGRRRSFSRRATLFRAAEIYMAEHAGPDGRIPATFEVITVMGWHPAASQQQPARRGSANARLADALDAIEHSTGEKPGSH